MSREIRKVPKNWEHPKRPDGQYEPLLDGDYEADIAKWIEGKKKWSEGLRDDWHGGWKEIELKYVNQTYEEWGGNAPQASDYMPTWKEEEKTHIQMYETCTEGTPISPVMDDPEKLARWLVDNNASAFGSMTATYEQWLSTIRAGWAPSSIASASTGVISGVEASANNKSTNADGNGE